MSEVLDGTVALEVMMLVGFCGWRLLVVGFVLFWGGWMRGGTKLCGALYMRDLVADG